MGAHRGGKGGHLSPSLEFEKNDVMCCCPTKYPKFFARAYGARLKYPIFQSKTAQKNAKIFVCAFGAPKKVNFLYGAPKTCQLFYVSVILPPSGKISAGAHDHL